MSSYDTEYKTRNLFGEPYPELIEYLGTFSTKGKLLDLGCGQGRDAIPFAQLGFIVTAIDISKVGIEQMREVAVGEDLDINSIVYDIYEYDSFDKFDYIILDSMLHFYKKDKEKETGLVKKIILNSKKGTIIVFCIRDSGSMVKILLETIESTNIAGLLKQQSFKFKWLDKKSGHKSFTNYQMVVIQI